MIRRLMKAIAPIAALALGASLSGCDSVDITINGEEGVPLAELDMAGAAPNELVVATNADVIVTQGETLDVAVENDPDNGLRFVLDGDTFGVTRDKGFEFDGAAPVVRVTMPPLSSITIAGSGSVEAQGSARDLAIAIGGSGSVTVQRIETQDLEISIGGSGSVTGAGTSDNLEIAIGGSGDVDLSALTVDKAEIAIGGSGDVAFASDGEVSASLAGSGNVTVSGSAKCTASSFGSGTLTCQPGSASSESEPGLVEES